MMKITALGGYSEVGRNMTAFEYNGKIVLLDMGIHLEKYIQLKGDDDFDSFSVKEMIWAEAIPDDGPIKHKRDDVVAIVPSHAHLDHIGAIPYMASRYKNAPIVCTPYTASVIKAILKDRKKGIANRILDVKNGSKIKVDDDITIEFVKMTHSIPDASLVIIHTPEGRIAYGNDFKLDDTPTMGEKPDYERMEEIGNEGINCLILDSLYAHLDRHTPSEAEAKEKLGKILLDSSLKGKGVIVTTFSSHIERLRSIIEFGKEMGRKVVMLGRSLGKYVYAAEDIGLVNFSGLAEMVPYKRQIKRKLREIDREGREKYLIVCTGHQGEPEAVLSRIAGNNFGYSLRDDDVIIFSCTVIPNETNIKNREMLEERISSMGANIFKDAHESGHGSRKDHIKMITMLRPKHLVPGHAERDRTLILADAAEKELGYVKGKTVHILEDGDSLEI